MQRVAIHANDYSQHLRGQISDDCTHRECAIGLAAFSAVEERYRKARERLAAAQQEKLEAAHEFLAARLALSHCMEEIWPDREQDNSAAHPAISFEVQPAFAPEMGIITP